MSRRVQFMRYLNEYRMLSIFQLDTVVVATVPFVFMYSISSFGGLGLIFTVIGSFLFSALIVYVYVKAKSETSKGFLKHWFFSKGLLRLDKNPDKWKELKTADDKDYFPNGHNKFFAD